MALCCGGGAIVALAGGNTDKLEASATADLTTTSGPTTSVPAGQATSRPSTAAGRTVTKAPVATRTPAAEVPTEPVATREAEPGIGDTVHDGDFDFTVTKLDCSKTKVGSRYLNEKAQGKFCMITVTVKNTGTESGTFSGTLQKAYDARGVEFSNDTVAELYANEGSPTYFEEINPGKEVKGKLVFDVPEATKLTIIELREILFIGGVKVSLS